MKINPLLLKLLLAVIASVTTFSYAEDIELYVNHNVELDEKPRVLMVFDTSGSMAWDVTDGGQCYKWDGVSRNTPRFSQITCFESNNVNDTNQCFRKSSSYEGIRYSRFYNSTSTSSGSYSGGYPAATCNDSRLNIAQSAIKQLVNDNDDIEFGLMRFNGANGGYVLARLGSSKSTLLNKIEGLPASGSTPLTETLWEAYRYISGKSVDFAGSVSSRDRTADISGSYISPFIPVVGEPLRCDNSVNIILMTDGDPTSDSNRNNNIKDLHNSYFTGSPPVVSGSYLTALAKVISGTKDVEVDLYTPTTEVREFGRVFPIGFGTGMSNSGKELLSQAATYGGGQYLHADTAEQLSEALKNTITRIREVNDTFTSPSVASNNVDQTRSRDSIYYAMFYPDSGARWRGNLKKLKVSGTQIVDSSSNQALDSNGLIDKGARTFWLPSTASADGNSVENGGVNLMLSTTASSGRKLFTDAGSSGLIAFTKNNVSSAYGGDTAAAAAFGVNKNDLQDTIDWARGIDVDNEDGDSSSSDQRADIFGDPLHSKPVTIDYGNDDVRILIGTNAGFLHMFKDAGNTVSESWAFIPSSVYGIIDPIRKNQADTKKYGIDGPITIYFDDANKDGVVNNSDRVWAFFGMRRGGHNYYGLDITNPDSPRLKWKIQGGSGTFKELAQTWSAPTVTFIKAFGDEPVLIFGAGYDTNKDTVVLGEDEEGRGIYIVKASDGSLLWELTPDNGGFKGKNSIAASLTALDSDYDGYVDRIYAADTSGSIWRIDMPSDKTSEWSHFELAKLNGTTNALDRRFFYKPMVARTMYSKVSYTSYNGDTVVTRKDTPFDAILIGSGNRSNPIGTITNDQLYMIRDTNTITKTFKSADIPEAITIADLMNVNSDPFGNALDDIEEFTEKEIDLGNKDGWYYDLPASGEKSLAAATVVGGVAYYTSYTPASATETVNQCSLTGGSGSLYAFHLHYGTKVYDQLSFITSNDVPDTPQLYFGSVDSCADNNTNGYCDTESGETEDEKVETTSQFLMIGPGIKASDSSDLSAQNPFIPKKINGPGISFDEDGKIDLTDDAIPIGFGFNTQQTFIYKREVNDNQK
ncbi:PilC/PilY family type IV pilus protein [Pseudoalteromonas shioyasakiensis]|uniref:pilus assembly protein n=1 Tax=Pseudoalteromonas shioyasakiensis TaxID=1190813 RepID=UPI00211773CF|nr:PilC/PilY family type IV pilus protein [Pseudoalteromonas shioyasakiensis]MCQ8877814.1 PilC/PilY family type IV pilus protein [Pseudoalteromonas shioyasakiensis]